MPGWRARAPLQDAARTPPVSVLRLAQPPAARVESAGGCSDLRPRPRDADGAHDLATHRVLLVAEYVLDTRAPSSASCSPTSGAPTADDFVRRAGGYGSASLSPSGPPQSAPSGRRCPPRPPCRYWRDRAHRPASDC